MERQQGSPGTQAGDSGRLKIAGRSRAGRADVQSQSRRPRQLDAWAERGAEVERVKQGEQVVDVNEGRGRLVAENARDLGLGTALRVGGRAQGGDGLRRGVLVGQRHGWRAVCRQIVRGAAEHSGL